MTVSNYFDRSVLAVAGPTLSKEFSIDEVGFSHVIVPLPVLKKFRP